MTSLLFTPPEVMGQIRVMVLIAYLRACYKSRSGCNKNRKAIVNKAIRDGFFFFFFYDICIVWYVFFHSIQEKNIESFVCRK